MTLMSWWEFINDLWKFIKKHNAIPHDWARVREEGYGLIRRHHEEPIVKAIIFDVMEVWDKEETEKKGN